jgi:hypothetical protein
MTRYPSDVVGGRTRGSTVNNLTRSRKLAFVALVALAMVLAVSAPIQARGMGGHGFGGGHPGGTVGPHGFDGHRGFDGHHFDRGVHGRFGFGLGPVFPYYGYYYPYPYYGDYPPAYSSEAPAYWYYCPSYGAYYPSVASCPEAWVPVPAS